MNSDEYRRRYNALLDLVSTRLPNFIGAVASKEAEKLIFHQDAFAADLQDEELVLLGAAMKFAGHHGKTIMINGRGGETIKDNHRTPCKLASL
jgi:hypothetical protein